MDYCRDRFRGNSFVCTSELGHDGDHRAETVSRGVVLSWDPVSGEATGGTHFEASRSLDRIDDLLRDGSPVVEA